MKSHKKQDDYIYHFAKYMIAARCEAEGIVQFTNFLHLVASMDGHLVLPPHPKGFET
jgi:hypothetical protein